MLTVIFQITLLVNLNTKSKQLYALKEVRESASANYKSLEEEKSRLALKICAILE